jgi:hypothetical protein
MFVLIQMNRCFDSKDSFRFMTCFKMADFLFRRTRLPFRSIHDCSVLGSILNRPAFVINHFRWHVFDLLLFHPTFFFYESGFKSISLPEQMRADRPESWKICTNFRRTLFQQSFCPLGNATTNQKWIHRIFSIKIFISSLVKISP